MPTATPTADAQAETGETLDFELSFKRRQPASWVVSQGKSDDSELGLVPPLPPGPWNGELVCIELHPELLVPHSGNSLRGQATIVDRALGLAKASAIGARGFVTNDGDGTLCLGGSPRPGCPDGAEYEACPAIWYITHAVDGSEDEILGPGSEVQTFVTVAPCSLDFLTQVVRTVALTFTLTDELEQQFSASTSVTGWGRFALGDLGGAFEVGGGTVYGQTRVTADSGSGGAILGVETVRSGSETATVSALEVPRDGAVGADVVTLP